jgi:peptidoglycan hydrolase CwlO-like protein
MIKGHIISNNGASKLNLYTMNKNGRIIARRSEDLIVASVPNCTNRDNQPLEQINFNIEEVKGWSWVKVENFENHFLVARVRGVCAVVIKKEQDSKTRKLLQNPKGQDEELKNKVTQTYELLSQAYSNEELFKKLDQEHNELKQKLDLFYQKTN